VRIKISRFGPIGIEMLGNNELRRGVLERFAIGGRLACAGTEARSAAALMRTPWLGSKRSGETSGQICEAGTFSSISRAPIRTIGSGSARLNRAKLIFGADIREASSVKALAWANAGALRSDATEERSGSASARSTHAAWKASA
jgi:hypothetical protein